VLMQGAMVLGYTWRLAEERVNPSSRPVSEAQARTLAATQLDSSLMTETGDLWIATTWAFVVERDTARARDASGEGVFASPSARDGSMTYHLVVQDEVDYLFDPDGLYAYAFNFGYVMRLFEHAAREELERNDHSAAIAWSEPDPADAEEPKDEVAVPATVAELVAHPLTSHLNGGGDAAVPLFYRVVLLLWASPDGREVVHAQLATLDGATEVVGAAAGLAARQMIDRSPEKAHAEHFVERIVSSFIADPERHSSLFAGEPDGEPDRMLSLEIVPGSASGMSILMVLDSMTVKIDDELFQTSFGLWIAGAISQGHELDEIIKGIRSSSFRTEAENLVPPEDASASRADVGPKVSFCEQCGSRLNPDSRYCGSCGSPTGLAA
jgi:hypothetical protein